MKSSYSWKLERIVGFSMSFLLLKDEDKDFKDVEKIFKNIVSKDILKVCCHTQEMR